MEIVGLPLLADNYAWFLVDRATGHCAVVDPSEADPVLARVRAEGWKLRWILATHHHWDHTGGIAGLVEAAGDLEVYCSRYDAEHGRVPHATRALEDGESIDVAGSVGHCLSVPGHTLGAVAYYFQAEAAVFTGDTLFTAGCGRLFEGTAEQMFQSLTKLRQLPAPTRVYCGHEYTEKNLRFAASVFSKDAAIAERLEQVRRVRGEGQPAVPATLDVERRTNPFLRADTDEARELLGIDLAAEAFAELRRRRDAF